MPFSASAIRPGPEEQHHFSAVAWMLAREHGLVRRVAEDEKLDGRCITLDGRRRVNFGSCSYLGLETDPRLKMGACEAVLRYGVQFSTSRAYVAAPPYRELEELLATMVWGSPVVVAPTTTLAHLSALPVLVGERDAVLYDVQVHASVQGALSPLRQQGVTCEPVRHNRLDRVEERVQALSATHERVFYLCDGVYSMHGDVLDANGLFGLLDRHPALWAYVDDAHGVGWCGHNGAGSVLGARPIHPRMVIVLGLAKSFAAAGGAIVVPSADLADKLLTCGRGLIFSGPLQPAQLGAAIASAQIHLSAELPVLQGELLTRIEVFDRAASAEDLPIASVDRSPIRFIPIGDEQAAIELAGALLDEGFYVNVAFFPAVPRRRAGVRLMLNRHHLLEDINDLVGAIAARLKAHPPEARPSSHESLNPADAHGATDPLIPLPHAAG